ncbi:hypothetical protein [Magnetospirillum sp. UT-4]|uniref:hypothetical protein n=1 Tax=Magnetospirillum sp. UT-4 TaxID=2681467 RepID=UPI00137E888A|nr:hypothetical protein [Magnetospirillum sp. UT-4]CAA7621230.1 conserved exported hypothetical protein [Magnetospirillum sp. UT-4]
MRRFLPALLLLLCAQPAAAADKNYDLGFARPGMMQGQFRFAAWPAGMNVYCSDDPDRPGTLGRLLALPGQMVSVGASRCALLSVDDKGVWSQAARKVAGHPARMTATFGPDRAGTSRLVQFFMEVPRAGYEDVGKFLVGRFGPPTEQGDSMLRWRNARQEAVLVHEGAESALLIMIDLALQEAMNSRMPGMGKR